MKKSNDWINVHDEDLMISLGIRPKNLDPRDPSVWTKTIKEKAVLKKLRNSSFGLLSKGASKEPYSPLFKGTLRFTIFKNDKYKSYDSTLNRKVYKTTFSIKCYKKDIPFILNKYVNERGETIVRKFSFSF